MKLPYRRRFLHLAAGAAALPAVSHFAWAQSYPSRPVRVIVPFAPAGSSDITARLLGTWLSERLGQQFVIDNRPGAASNIGTEAVVHAPSDGYTLLLASAPAAINATLYEKLNFNFLRDITPVASIARIPLVIAVNPSVPAKTLPDFIAYAKANPAKINFASAGSGSPIHMAAELFKMMAGINLAHVPYRGGGPALIDLLGGQVQVMFATVPGSLEYIRAGKLVPLAATSTVRLDVLPNIPTTAEHVPGFEASDWTGLGAPKNTPMEIVVRLNKDTNAALADPGMKARLGELGCTVLPGSPTDFGKLIADETEKWARVIKFSGAKPD
jgi:tripartite-type tricarboxylate transporter receptor subunit TctC